MNAVLQAEVAKRDTILTYATEEDLEEVRQVFLRGDALQADVKHIRTALAVASRNLGSHNMNASDRAKIAAARALGESVPIMAHQRSLTSLQEEVTGLEARLAEAVAIAERHSGDYRTAVCQLLRKCAERAAEDYVEATKRQAWAHLQLGIVQSIIGRVVDELYWNKYTVPGSDHLAALKHKGRLEDDGSGGPCLTYMSADRLALGIKDAAKELRQHIYELFAASPL
jgi:hypothetical protein